MRLPPGVPLPEDETKLDYSIAMVYDGPPVSYDVPKAEPLDVSSHVTCAAKPISESQRLVSNPGPPVIEPITLPVSHIVGVTWAHLIKVLEYRQARVGSLCLAKPTTFLTLDFSEGRSRILESSSKKLFIIILVKQAVLPLESSHQKATITDNGSRANKRSRAGQTGTL
ncbi:hypothetical protein OIU79_026099 [Salix purpurea]|uniref:Uncharacterized protein n=1 Tax=Salix purpurea TaxID=77065 RepID=A0A9Q0NNF0_SALPP|nr:hypothetical protein OIU79_026099 [Salix purpurea]